MCMYIVENYFVNYLLFIPPLIVCTCKCTYCVICRSNEEYKVLLIWDKALNLLIRQLKFGGNIAAVINQFTTIAALLQRLGEDKATEGLLGAIGLGKKSSFSLE